MSSIVKIEKISLSASIVCHVLVLFSLDSEQRKRFCSNITFLFWLHNLAMIEHFDMIAMEHCTMMINKKTERSCKEKKIEDLKICLEKKKGIWLLSIKQLEI